MTRKLTIRSLGAWKEFFLVLFVNLISMNVVVAQNGSSFQRTATFADGDGSASFTIEVGAPSFSGTVTYLWLELGSDGTTTPSSPVPATIPANFGLSLGGGASQPLTVGMSSTTLFTNKTIEFEQEDAAKYPNFYNVKITHGTNVLAAETWVLTVSGLPSGSPALTRAVAFSQQAVFTSVDPAGVGESNSLYTSVNVTSSTNTITFSATLENADPSATYIYHWYPENQASIGTWSGESTSTLTFTKPTNVTGCCKLVTFRVEVRKSSDPSGDPVTVNRGSSVLTGDSCGSIVSPHWPPFQEWEFIPVCIDCPFPGPWPPGPVCLSCPPEWRTPFDPEYERTVVAFTPMDKDGKLVGPDKAGLIKLTLAQGKTVGGIVDVGNGSYLQVVETPKGSKVQASLSVGKVTSKEFSIETRSASVASYKNMAYGLGVLLVISLIGNGLIARRGLQRGKQMSG